MLGRTTDKARANNARSLGDYDFGCPMDRGVLSFLGIEPAEYAQRVAELGTDVRIEAWVRESYLEHKATADVERFNNEFLVSPVPLPDGHPLKFVTNEYFYQLRTQLAPDRSDLTSLADILDVDENVRYRREDRWVRCEGRGLDDDSRRRTGNRRPALDASILREDGRSTGTCSDRRRSA